MQVCIPLVVGAALVCAALSGCSQDELKRTAYETVQNVGQQQCDKELSTPCPDREDYQTYQERLESLETQR